MARARSPLAILLQRLLPLLLCLPLTLQALGSDRHQPIEIEADRAMLNEKDGSSVYEGDVHLRQGTLNLRGSRMTVQITDERLEKIVLSGEPASYRQRPEDEDTDQHAEAGRIEYYAIEERMVLLNDARIWQSDTEEFSSDRIVFNLRDNTVNAGGEGPGDRVRITLQPRNPPPAPEPETGDGTEEPESPAATDGTAPTAAPDTTGPPREPDTPDTIEPPADQ